MKDTSQRYFYAGSLTYVRRLVGAVCVLVLGYSAIAIAQPPNGPMSDVLEALARIEERIDTIENKVDNLQNTVFAEVTEFLSFSVCNPTAGVLEGGLGLNVELGLGGKAGVGVHVFGNGVKGSTHLTGDVSAEVGLDVESGISSEVCVDILKLAAFIEDQVQSNNISEQNALKLALGQSTKLSPDIEAMLFRLVDEIGDRAIFAEDMLLALSPFIETMGPQAQLAAAMQVSNIATEFGTSILTDPNAIPNYARQFSDFLPFGNELQAAFASVAQLPQQILQLDPCSLPVIAGALSGKCSFADLGERLPELIGYLEELDGLGDQLIDIQSDIQGVGDLIDFSGLETQLSNITSDISDIRGPLLTAASQVQTIIASLGDLAVANGIRNQFSAIFDRFGNLFGQVFEIGNDVRSVSALVDDLRARVSQLRLLTVIIADLVDGISKGVKKLLGSGCDIPIICGL